MGDNHIMMFQSVALELIQRLQKHIADTKYGWADSSSVKDRFDEWLNEIGTERFRILLEAIESILIDK